ncbi:MAG: subclass B3 metallo-beta-lactamase [Alphaproteobacteria bacterium]|nr:subclass B3 metallo-beta-lactamase [Alphaproteobacteria bacterium]
MKSLFAAAATLMLTGPAHAELPFVKERAEWSVPQKPFHVIGNIYYVGMAGVSAFLIVTPAGNILTDGGLPESAPFIEKNIQALGFKLSDVKILLNSHVHFDHSGGLARLKADTGAKFYASTGDKPFLESGHIPYGPSSLIDTTPIHVDRAMKDGESFTLGGVTMTANVLPGHTRGCTTWTRPLTDAGVTHKVMFFCSISVAGNPIAGKLAYPTIVSDYRASFARLKKMDADIFLAPHGGQFHMEEKLAKMKPGAPNPFIDAKELPDMVQKAEAAFDKDLARQQAGGAAYVPR